VCFVAAILYNGALASAFGPDPFQWIPFLLAMVCLGAFALIGRTIPTVFATAELWLKVAVTVFIAVVAWAASLVCWFGRMVCRSVKAILYALAYPFFLVFWRRKLELAEEPSAEHV
jgi:hypothetical protein